MPNLSFLVCEMGDKWSYSCCFFNTAVRIFFQNQHVAFLCSSHLAIFLLLFFFNVSLEPRWSNYTVEPTQPQVGSNSVLFFSEISGFHMIDNLSIEVHAFPTCILALLSVDEILMSRYLNMSPNFRGIPLKVGMVLFCFRCLILRRIVLQPHTNI